MAAEVESVVRHWPIGCYLRHHHLTAGRNNISYKVETDHGNFVLRQCRKSKTTQSLVFEYQLIGHLRSEGISAPGFIGVSDGQKWLSEAGRLWTLSPFINGSHPSRSKQAAELGGNVLAQFHKAIEKFNFPGFVPPEENRITEILGILQHCQSNVGKIIGLQALVDRSLKAARNTATALQTGSGVLPRTIIHGSCRLTSLLVEEGKLTALLDMDSARYGTCAEDIGIALASFAKCRDGEYALDELFATTMTSAYCSVSAIDNSQAEAIPGYFAQSLLYSWAKAFERYVYSEQPEIALLDKAKWRLNAAEHALADPKRITRLVLHPNVF